MEIVQDDLWLCDDCTIYAVNGDMSGIESERRERQVVEGVNELGPHLVPDFDSETDDGIEEFSRRPCDACGTRLGGGRHRFAVLGEETRENPASLSTTDILLGLGGLAAVGLVGYLVYKQQQASQAAAAAAALPVVQTNMNGGTGLPVASSSTTPPYIAQ
jgi:hypothetical protein